MQAINETAVFQKSYDLYKTLHAAVKKYPKGDRHSLGEKTKEETLGLVEAITKAGYAKKEWKLPHVEQAAIGLELVKVLIRLGYDTRCLDEKAYVAMQS